MPDRIRLDVVVDAMWALQRYCETDPTVNDPMPLLTAATKAVDELKKLETTLPGRVGKLDPGRDAPLPTVIAEWRKKHAAFLEQKASLSAFVKTHGKDFEALTSTIRTVNKLIAVLDSIDKRLALIQPAATEKLRKTAVKGRAA
jgi:hypothetical protein